jgi:glucose dehydrogenase
MLCAVVFVAQAQAPYDRIRRAESEPGSWLTYSGTYGGHRFSALSQITPGNVARLKPAWIYQTNDLNKSRLAARGGWNRLRFRARSGRGLDIRTAVRCGSTAGNCHETFTPAARSEPRPGYPRRLLFLGTLDAHLIALDMRTGKLR